MDVFVECTLRAQRKSGSEIQRDKLFSGITTWEKFGGWGVVVRLLVKGRKKIRTIFTYRFLSWQLSVRAVSKSACRCFSEEIGGQQLKGQAKCGPSDESGCVFVSACRMTRVSSNAFTPVVSTVEAFCRCKRSTFPRRGFPKQRLSPDQSRSFSPISGSFCVQDVLDG